VDASHDDFIYNKFAGEFGEILSMTLYGISCAFY